VLHIINYIRSKQSLSRVLFRLRGDDYLSRRTVAGELLPHLSTLTTDVAVSFSMALSLRSPSPDVIWHPALWSSDFPRVQWTRNRLSYLLQFSLS